MKYEYYIFKINKEQTNNNGAFKYRYYLGDKELKKDAFIKYLRYIIKDNNKNFYRELYNVYNGDFIQHYKNGYYDLLLDFKSVIDELKHAGVIYNFKI